MAFQLAQYVKTYCKNDAISVLSQEDKETYLRRVPGRTVRTVYSNDEIVVLAHKWINYLGQEVGISVAEGTVDQYSNNLTYLVRWIERSNSYGDLSIDDTLRILTRRDLREWILSMKAEGLNLTTIHNREVVVKQFLDWLTTSDAGKQRLKKDSPYGEDDDVSTISKKPNKKSPKAFTSEQVISILNNLHNENERCMFHAQYEMGLRISELINFKKCELPDPSMYDPTTKYIPVVIQGVKGRAGTNKERITLISLPVLNRIKRYHSTKEYLFAADWDINDPNKPVFLTVHLLKWNQRNASKQFKNAVRRTNLSEAVVNHWMRHGTAMSILSSDIGKDIYDRMLIAQQILGHSRLSSTEIYTQISPAILADLSKDKQGICRYDEAEKIRSATYLPPLQHKEKRGHK